MALTYLPHGFRAIRNSGLKEKKKGITELLVVVKHGFDQICFHIIFSSLLERRKEKISKLQIKDLKK